MLTYRVFPQSLSSIGLTLTVTLLHLIFKPLSQKDNRIWQLTANSRVPIVLSFNPKVLQVATALSPFHIYAFCLSQEMKLSVLH